MDPVIIGAIFSLFAALVGSIVSAIIAKRSEEPDYSFILKYLLPIFVMILILLVIYLLFKIELKEESIRQLKESNAQLIEIYEQRIVKSKEAIDFEEKRFKDAKEKACELALERDKLTGVLNKKEQELVQLNIKLDEMRRKGIEVDSLKEVIENKRHEIRILIKERPELTNEIDHYKNKLQESIDAFESLENDLENVEQEILKRVPDNRKFIASVDTLRNKITGIKKINTTIAATPPDGLPPASSKPIKQFRSKTKNFLRREATKLIRDNNSFDRRWNSSGEGFDNQFELKEIHGDKIVYDHACGLIWQQSGSPNSVKYNGALEYINLLNSDCFAGFSSWRLPTLEEALSLLEPEKMNGNLWNDPIFDQKQQSIWTCDQVKGESQAWIIIFTEGYSYFRLHDHLSDVRAVRSSF